MKNVFKQLLGLLLALAFLSSCGKDDDDVQVVPQGGIKVTVAPAGAATAMRVTKDGTTIEVSPDANSMFLVENLTEGQYSITFTPASGYQASAAQTVSVTGGDITNMGTVTMQRIVIPGFSGTITASINGSGWSSPAPTGMLNGDTLSFGGPSVTTSGGDAIALIVTKFTGTGTYSGFNGAFGIYTVNPTSTSPPTWDTLLGSCSVTITKYDQASKLISGTFSFTAKPSMFIQNNTATGTKTVTNGVFTDVKLQ